MSLYSIVFMLKADIKASASERGSFREKLIVLALGILKPDSG